jgi:hypothetical protein
LTAGCKAFSLANVNGTGTNELGIQVFRLAEEEKKKGDLWRDLQKPFGEFKTVNSLQDDKY